MNQIRADIADERVVAIFLRPRIARVDGAAAGSGEVSAQLFFAIQAVFVVAFLPQFRALLAPFLWAGQREHRRGWLPVIRDVLLIGGDFH